MARSHCAGVIAIASAKGRGDWQAVAARCLDDKAITRFEPCIGEREAPELIIAVRINSRLIKHEIGRELPHDFRQVAGKLRHIAIITHAIGQGDIAA